jgi:hypothetical protein
MRFGAGHGVAFFHHGTLSMAKSSPEWLEHQRRRWRRHDAHRFMRPGGAAHDRCLREQADVQSKHAVDSSMVREIEEIRTDLARLREIAMLQRELRELKLQRLSYDDKAYNPNQPRVLAGSPDGGQWTLDGGQGDRVRVAQFSSTITDAEGRPYYRPGGHHEMPEGVYKKWSLQPETRKIFRQSSTGTLGGTIRATPDGVRQGNIWDGESGPHRAYNQAVEELSNKFIQAHNLRQDASDMTPDHAIALLKQIRESEDPRIRDFNALLRRIQRLRRLRGGPD